MITVAISIFFSVSIYQEVPKRFFCDIAGEAHMIKRKKGTTKILKSPFNALDKNTIEYLRQFECAQMSVVMANVAKVVT